MRPWPDLSHEDLARCASAVAESGSLSNGHLVEMLEFSVESMFRGAEVIAVSSATTGLEAILCAAGAGHGTEVIVPEYGFPAAALAARRLGAEVLLARVIPETLTVEPESVARLISDYTRAVVGIDVAGYPCWWSQLERVCKDRGVVLVEDAASAWGTVHRGRACGTFGDAAVLSLSQTKIVGAGEGGLVVTNDHALASRIRALRRYGENDVRTSMRRTMNWAGSNWKMTEFAAAVALVQLDRLPSRKARAVRNRERLDESLRECNYLCGIPVEAGDTVCPHKYRVVAVGEVNHTKLVEAAARQVPVMYDDVLPLGEHPPFARSVKVPTRRGDGALSRSFILGGRDFPIWHASEESVVLWCDRLAKLDEEANKWLR